jgi:hydrogenase maturation protease
MGGKPQPQKVYDQQMANSQVRILILACGNTLRSDDGIGPWLAQWAQEKFAANPAIRVIERQQWTPDLAEDIAQAAAVLFIDCSIQQAPGEVLLTEVQPTAPDSQMTHHISAEQLLAVARDLYNAHPSHASLGETFSQPVFNAIPQACDLLQHTVNAWQSENG